MKSEGSDRRTNYVNSLTGSSSSHPLNPSDGGGLSSLDGQNNAAHVNGNSRINQNTKTSSQLGKTRDGIVSVPQPLSKSADRRFWRRKWVVIATIAVLMIIVASAFALQAMLRRSKQIEANKYKYNICSESEVDEAIGYYKARNADELRGVSMTLYSRNNYISDAKCLYINAVSAILTGAKSNARYFLSQIKNAIDRDNFLDYLSKRNYPSIEDLSTAIDKMRYVKNVPNGKESE